jgi:2-methylcitrate dehydratase PrpD
MLLDMDDGYSLLRGHPGSGFFGALLTAAEESKCTYGEVLAALVVAYEVSNKWKGILSVHYYGLGSQVQVLISAFVLRP